MIKCNIKACAGCRTCETACSSFHFGAVSPLLSRIRVAKLEEIGIDLAIACRSCLEKPCLECPTDALFADAAGIIRLEAELCIGCGQCVEACPIGAVGFYDDLPLFCDLCDGATSCIEACPTGALTFREDHGLVSLAHLPPEDGAARRRARYAAVEAEPVRAGWKNGLRIDS